MTLRDDLIAAKGMMIDTPDKWEECTAQNAVLQAIDHLDADRWLAARRALLQAMPGHTSIAAFNYDPETTHDDVVALFDRAIAAAPTLTNTNGAK